jgi:hypothetical protein
MKPMGITPGTTARTSTTMNTALRIMQRRRMPNRGDACTISTRRSSYRYLMFQNLIPKISFCPSHEDSPVGGGIGRTTHRFTTVKIHQGSLWSWSVSRLQIVWHRPRARREDVGVPEQRFKGSRSNKQPGVDTVEVGKICIYLEYPVRLRYNNTANVDHAATPSQERLALDPGNDVVEGPRCEKQDHGRGEVPAPYGWLEEDEKGVGNGKNELFGRSSSARLAQGVHDQRGLHSPCCAMGHR